MSHLDFDFPGMRIGVAEYPEGPTGCTVFAFDRGVICSADVRGGSSGTVFANEDGFVNAICFAGGSLLGLEAASGVASEIFAKRGHQHVEWLDVPLVAGAIVFDFLRKTGHYPDKALGAAAYRAARANAFPIGRVGAGANVYCGKGVTGLGGERSGQGAAALEFGACRIVVVTVVNAMGAIVDRQGNVVRGHLDAKNGERYHLHEALRAGRTTNATPNQNTTLTLLATNLKLPSRELKQVARQVHASMARAIQPFHTVFDGDALFAVTTNAVEEPSIPDGAAFGALASEVAWDAVLSIPRE